LRLLWTARTCLYRLTAPAAETVHLWCASCATRRGICIFSQHVHGCRQGLPRMKLTLLSERRGLCPTSGCLPYLYGMLSLMIGGLTNVSSLSPRRHDSILGKSFSSGVSTPPLNMELRELTCSLRKGVQSMLSVRQDRPSVFLMNLRIQHLVIDHSLDNTEKMVHKFFEKINHHRTIDENDRSIGKRNSRFHPKSHFVLLNSMSMLGFRQPYCTNARAEIFSAMVPRVADQAGWLVLDGYNMSLLRPDLALDGMQVSPLGHGMLCLDQTLSIEDVSRP